MPKAISAQSPVCGEIDVEGLQTQCYHTEDWDETSPTGTSHFTIDNTDYGKYGQTFKCLDTVTSCGPKQRCCVVPLDGQYGGQCHDPKTTRDTLGIGSSVSLFDGLRPQNCKKKSDEPVEKGYNVVIENVKGAFEKALAKSVSRETINRNPDLTIAPGGSEGGLVFETVIQGMYCVNDDLNLLCDTKPATWYYEVRADGKKAFFYANNVLENAGELNTFWRTTLLITTAGWSELAKSTYILLRYVPHRDPRPDAEAGYLEEAGCWASNAAKRPFFTMVNGIGKMFTGADDYPDVTLLCNKGAPQFLSSSGITIDASYNVTFATEADRANCRCADITTGPANASVLLCTKYVLGVGENNPWRSVIPDQFSKTLLFGGATASENLQEMRAGVKSAMKEFFDNRTNVMNWLINVDIRTRTVAFPDPFTIRTRLFGEKYANPEDWGLGDNTVPIATTDMDKIVNGIQSNYYAKEFISCLSCATYGGFQSSIGCLPMDKVERFISEGLLGIGLTIGGAFCLLGFIYGAIMFQLSMGDSTKINNAKKIMTRFVTGLILMLFAIFILRFIGVDLLRIPGLS